MTTGQAASQATWLLTEPAPGITWTVTGRAGPDWLTHRLVHQFLYLLGRLGLGQISRGDR